MSDSMDIKIGKIPGGIGQDAWSASVSMSSHGPGRGGYALDLQGRGETRLEAKKAVQLVIIGVLRELQGIAEELGT